MSVNALPPDPERGAARASGAGGVPSAGLAVARVTARQTALTIPELGFGSDGKDLPRPLTSGDRDGAAAGVLYLGGVSKAVLATPVLDHATGQMLPPSEPALQGHLFSALIHEGVMAVIITPIRGDGPAYWIRLPLESADIGAAGKRRRIRRRPAGVAVAIGDDLTLGFFEVTRYWPDRDAAQPGQEREMLADLRAQQPSGGLR